MSVTEPKRTKKRETDNMAILRNVSIFIVTTKYLKILMLRNLTDLDRDKNQTE